MGRERRSLLEAPSVGKPVGPVELGACCPVRIAQVAKQSFRCNEVVLHRLVLASCASDQCPGALYLGSEERRNFASRAGRQQVGESIGFPGVAEVDRRLDRDGEGETDRFVSDGEPSVESLVDRAAAPLRAPGGASFSARKTAACPAAYDGFALHIVALCPGTAAQQGAHGRRRRCREVPPDKRVE